LFSVSFYAADPLQTFVFSIFAAPTTGIRHWRSLLLDCLAGQRFRQLSLFQGQSYALALARYLFFPMLMALFTYSSSVIVPSALASQKVQFFFAIAGSLYMDLHSVTESLPSLLASAWESISCGNGNTNEGEQSDGFHKYLLMLY
jgi:hypothetical protein